MIRKSSISKVMYKLAYYGSFPGREDILPFIVTSILAVKPTQLTLKWVVWELSSPINWLRSVDDL
jgi:hypothetical protein